VTKTIFLLNIGQYAPAITRLTYPFINLYAKRIGATVHPITERKFPEWPVVYEKLQIFELAKQTGSDWNIYIDSDALIHPECPDFTVYLSKGTVLFYRFDNSLLRFKADEYFYRNGRYISPGNWFTIASDLCLDLWHPLELTLQETMARITPTPKELAFGMTAEHLVDDYALAQNLSRFGFQFKSGQQICKEYGFDGVPVYRDGQDNLASEFFYHEYLLSVEEKAGKIAERIKEWRVEKYLEDFV